MYTIGIDLGGTNIVASVVNEKYEILGTGHTPTLLPRDADAIFDDMALVCRKAVEDANLTMEDISSIGLGTPGTVNADGIIEYSNNLKFEDLNARQMLTDRLGNVPIYLENDANCAALGEAYAGCGCGSQNFIAVTLGTGVGSGIILNGKIVSGINCAGGECGHTVIVVDGEPCNCGRNGCWEAYASASALIRQTKEAMDKNPESAMHELAKKEGKVSGRTAFDAMRLGDEAGKAVVDQYIKYVACGVTNLVSIFQPEIVCIGGGICNEGETLLGPIREYVEKERYSKHSKKQTKIMKAELGNNAGVIGAAILGSIQ